MRSWAQKSLYNQSTHMVYYSHHCSYYCYHEYNLNCFNLCKKFSVPFTIPYSSLLYFWYFSLNCIWVCTLHCSQCCFDTVPPNVFLILFPVLSLILYWFCHWPYTLTGTIYCIVTSAVPGTVLCTVLGTVSFTVSVTPTLFCFWHRIYIFFLYCFRYCTL